MLSDKDEEIKNGHWKFTVYVRSKLVKSVVVHKDRYIAFKPKNGLLFDWEEKLENLWEINKNLILYEYTGVKTPSSRRRTNLELE